MKLWNVVYDRNEWNAGMTTWDVENEESGEVTWCNCKSGSSRGAAWN